MLSIQRSLKIPCTIFQPIHQGNFISILMQIPLRFFLIQARGGVSKAKILRAPYFGFLSGVVCIFQCSALGCCVRIPVN